jgi:hypothetical protein
VTSHPRRFLWLDLLERGTPVATIARRHHLPIPTVQAAIDTARCQHAAFAESLARLRPPPLVLCFPINGLFPSSRCNHDHVPIPDGDLCCCAVCHRSGRDHHPALDRFPEVEPRPDPVPRPTLAAATKPATRREKRAAKKQQAA